MSQKPKFGVIVREAKDERAGVIDWWFTSANDINELLDKIRSHINRSNIYTVEIFNLGYEAALEEFCELTDYEPSFCGEPEPEEDTD